ncbi:MAG: hypothetical protein ACK56I_32350, partial [bacterium]
VVVVVVVVVCLLECVGVCWCVCQRLNPLRVQFSPQKAVEFLDSPPAPGAAEPAVRHGGGGGGPARPAALPPAGRLRGPGRGGPPPAHHPGEELGSEPAGFPLGPD